MMLNKDSLVTESIAAFPRSVVAESISSRDLSHSTSAFAPALQAALDDDGVIEWSEEDIVLLHWRLLKEVSDLSDPETPLEEKLDTLRWIFTEREKENRPFSFVNCLKVVGCSALSPTPYFGLVNVEEIRHLIRCQAKAWLNATLERYPSWVREAVFRNPEWVANALERNPQWLNEQVKKHTVQGDLFA